MTKTFGKILGPLLAVAVFFLFFHGSPAQRFNNRLVGAQEKVVTKIDRFIESYNSDLQIGLEKYYQEMLDQARAAVDTVEKLETFSGGEDLHDSMLRLLDFYLEFAENNARELVMLAGRRQLSAAEQQQIDQISDYFDREEDIYLEEFNRIQAAFAEKFDLEIER